MAVVKVKIIRITDLSFPGFIEFELTDSKGKNHRFIDKIPVVCECEIYITDFPSINENCMGKISCIIKEEKEKTFIINTEYPWDIESTDGEYEFEVWKNQVVI